MDHHRFKGRKPLRQLLRSLENGAWSESFQYSAREKGKIGMRVLEFMEKAYEIDDENFLVKPDQWDERFAEGMAPRVGITGGLTDAHWKVIRFIRERFSKSGEYPMVYETCRAHQLRSVDLQRLFPSGYLRACKLTGLTLRAEEMHPSWLPQQRMAPVTTPLHDRVYRVNVRGFLVNPGEWDEDFALFKAQEMKIPGLLSEKHWQIIRFLREQFTKTGKVPTVFEACSENHMEMDELEKLFPDGYHRGAVKLAGLHVV